MQDSLESIKLKPHEWDRLRDLVDRFEEAWKKQGDVDPANYLPGPNDPLRLAVLRELVRTDMEIRSRRGTPADLASYLRRFPELGEQSAITATLLFEEYRLRQRFGQPVSLGEYRERYPRQFDELSRLVVQSGESVVEKLPSLPTPLAGPSMLPQDSKILPIGGEYRLLEEIGRGTFGVVHKALAPGGFLQAVKTITRTVDGEEASRELRALEVMRRLRHPNLLQVIATWPLENRLIIVMELADGNLRQRMKQCHKEGHKGIPREELCRHMHEAAAGLDYLHSQKALHRDVKPDNILLLDGVAKLGDFGLVRDQNLVMSMMRPVGTPPYMAPEVWGCAPVAASDQYALACCYVELRCGRRPFPQASFDSLQDAHRQGPPDLSELSTPEQQVLARALAKQPTQRYATCAAFVRALEGVIGLEATPAAPRIPATLPPPGVDHSTTDMGSLVPGGQPRGRIPRTPPDQPYEETATLDAPVVHPVDWRRAQEKRKAPIAQILLVLGCLAVVGVLTWFLLFRNNTPPPGPDPGREPGAVVLETKDFWLQGGTPRPLALRIERKGFEGTIKLTFEGADIAIDPVTIPEGKDSVTVEAAVKGSPAIGARKLTVTAEPGKKTSELEIPVLPAGFEPAPGAQLTGDGGPSFSRLVRKIDKQEVYFLLIRPSGAAPFYLTENKVSNGVFAVYAQANPLALTKSAWERGGKKAGKDLGFKGHDRLPVFRITRAEAEAFAKWLGGRLPTAAQLDAAAVSGTKGEVAAVDRWEQGPRPVNAGGEGIHDLDGNGREWTRDVLVAGGETLAILRGRSYAAHGLGPMKDEPATQHPSYASPYTGFRVVIELPG
jgi:serine/threonine protein kinase